MFFIILIYNTFECNYFNGRIKTHSILGVAEDLHEALMYLDTDDTCAVPLQDGHGLGSDVWVPQTDTVVKAACHKDVQLLAEVKTLHSLQHTFIFSVLTAALLFVPLIPKIKPIFCYCYIWIFQCINCSCLLLVQVSAHGIIITKVSLASLENDE